MIGALVPRAKIWGEGEYENAQGWMLFGKWVIAIALLAAVIGIPAALVLNNQDIFN